MKHAVLVLTLFTLPPSLFAQGQLTPPGAPAPTMLTLSQVEPRTPITNTTSVVISAPGSYYLTGNITVSTNNAITINASGVTLDLNGFTVSSTAPTPNANGILLAAGLSDITILNGHIRGGVTNSGGVYAGSGFGDGINYTSQEPFNVLVSHVTVAGCENEGIHFGTNSSTAVDSCTVQTVGGEGIAASTVTRSTAYQCGGNGIEANIVSDCYGYSTGGDGLVASFSANNCCGVSTGSGAGLAANIANNCYGQSSTGNGLDATSANNCSGVSSNGDGLSVAQTATGCSGQSSSGGGIGLFTQNGIATGCYGVNSASSGYGLEVNIAIGCYGQSGSNGVGLAATVSTSCLGSPGKSVTYAYIEP
jgi:hypothetical protein